MKNPFSINRLPIKIKITLWYAISFMAVTAFSFISFYYVTKNIIISKVDDSLKTQVAEILNILNEKTLTPASKEFVLNTFKTTKTNMILILNEENQIVAQSQSFPIDKKIINSLLDELNETKGPIFSSKSGIRFHLMPIKIQNRHLGTIIAGDSISAIQDAFDVLFNALILIFFIFSLPLTLVSFLEAEITLSPLRDLGDKLNTITTKNLSSRVNIVNEKDEIGEVSKSINNLLDRLQEGFNKERQLIYDVSHQLKTPLTAMRSDLEISLSKKRNVHDYRKILKNLLQDTKRMSNILKDMVNFAWAATQQQNKNFKKINLSDILNELGEIIHQLAYEKKIKVRIDIANNIIIDGQKEKIFQAFMNIAENSVKYTPKGGKITIKAIEEENNIKVFIKDNGIGILKTDINKIFDRFYRGKKNQESGSGLGLSIAAALIKAHKGRIEVSSSIKKGTTFIVYLPNCHKQHKQETKHYLNKNNKKHSIKPIKISSHNVKNLFKNRFLNPKK